MGAITIEATCAAARDMLKALMDRVVAWKLESGAVGMPLPLCGTRPRAPLHRQELCRNCMGLRASPACLPSAYAYSYLGPAKSGENLMLFCRHTVWFCTYALSYRLRLLMRTRAALASSSRGSAHLVLEGLGASKQPVISALGCRENNLVYQEQLAHLPRMR
jgi:hypothetical protein